MNDRMPTLVCRSCGVDDEPELAWQTFANGTLHLRASCRSCGRYIQYVPQTPEWLDVAPGRAASGVW